MSKGNAKQMLQKTITRLKQVKGQRVAVVFTREDNLSVVANAQYTDFINDHKNVVWDTLACYNPSPSIPSRDLEIATNITGDLKDCSVKSLRTMISWITQKSTGWFSTK